jgi:hypothetical protein
VTQRLTDSRGAIAFRVAPNAAVAAVVGAGYALVAVVSIAVTLGSVLATSGESDHSGVSGVRTASYLTMGLVLLCAVVQGRAKVANSLLGGAYLAAGVTLALFTDGDPQLLALNHPDNVVHLCTAALLVGFGRTQD